MIPLDRLWDTLGYTPDQIEQFKRIAEEDPMPAPHCPNCDHELDEFAVLIVAQEIFEQLRSINRKLTAMSDQQASIDAAVSNLTTANDNLTAAVAGIASDVQALKDEIQALKDQGAPVDLTGLEAAVTAIDGSVQAASDLDAANPPAP